MARPMTSRPKEWNVEARTPVESIPAAANRADPFLQLGGRIPVEGQQQDALGGDKAPADSVSGPGDHHRCLPGARGGQDMDPVIEAHDRPCLLVGERALLDHVEERATGGELGRGDPLVGIGNQLCQVGVEGPNCL